MNFYRLHSSTLFLLLFLAAPPLSPAYPASPLRATVVSSQRVSQQNDPVAEILRTAHQLYKDRKFTEALAECAKAKALDANDFRVHAVTGLVYQGQNQLKSASDEFAEAIRLKPSVREFYFLKAWVDFLRNAREDAITAAQGATKVDPSYAEAFALLGSLLRWDEKRRPEAISALRAAIRLKPALQGPYSDLGGILLAAKDLSGAEAIFRQGMEADPTHMAGRFALGRMLVEQGRLKEARQVWEGRTSDRDDTHPRFIEELQWAEDLDRAKTNLAQHPNDPEALTDMGLATLQGPTWVVDGREEQALVFLRKALALKPDSARTQASIVRAYIQRAATFDSAKAVLDREMEKLRRMDPKLAGEMADLRAHYNSGPTLDLDAPITAGPLSPSAPAGPGLPPAKAPPLSPTAPPGPGGPVGPAGP